jgi:MSHA pilin protein MshC
VAKLQQGFTLIELITVIILLGILSAFAISRFPSAQGYSATIIKNQLIASARLAQQTALSRASAGANVVLNVSVIAGQWNLVVSGGGISYSSQIDRGDEQIRFGTDLVSACSALAVAPLAVSFDGDGNQIPSQNLRICIDSASASFSDYEICISPSGYAYEGSCL